MSKIYSFTNYKSFLKDDLRIRTLRNPRYSLRAYARDLGISFSRLSEILSSNEGISLVTAGKIANVLGLSEHEKDYFFDLILAKHSRNAHMKKVASEKLKKHKSEMKFKVLENDFDGLLSKWFYLPLIELLCLGKMCSSYELSQVFRVSDVEIEEAIGLLEKLGYIKKKPQGDWEKREPYLSFDSKKPSQQIRNFHHKFLHLADEALEQQTVENRKFISGVMSFNKKMLPEARQEIELFKNKFLKKYTTPHSADSVYCFTMQYFELTQRTDIM